MERACTVSTKAEKALRVFEQRFGTEELSEWFEIDQRRVDAFAEATLDRQFIHVDPEQAAQTPFGGTIAHGFLTLSIISHFAAGLNARDPAPFENVSMGINYGLNKVRFPSPVKVGSKIRLRRELLAAELKGTAQVHVVHRCTIEVQGQDKPGCVAETLSRFVYE